MGKNWPVDVKINGLTVAELPSVEAEEVDQPNDEPQKDESSDTKYRQPGGSQLNQFLAKPKANVHYGSGDIYSDIGTLNITKNSLLSQCLSCDTVSIKAFTRLSGFPISSLKSSTP